MPSTEMALRIDPDTELRFRGPFTSPVTSILKLTNPTDRRVIFKIKTTAPKRYCVRPNAGIIEPGGHLSVAVVLQPCELEQSAHRHKFMVRAIYAPAGEINQDELWRSSSSIMETKLRCHFEHPPAPGQDPAIDDSPPLQHQQNQENQGRVVSAEGGKGSVGSGATPAHQKDDHFAAANSNVGSGQQQLTEEERRIKRENRELKEEVDRLRRKLKQRVEAGDSMLSTASAAPPSQAMAWIVLCIIVAMLSVILGKFVL